jgi:hypothetical protein
MRERERERERERVENKVSGCHVNRSIPWRRFKLAEFVAFTNRLSF